MDQTTEFNKDHKITKHNLKEALHTISGIVAELEDGYRFDDDDAKELIQCLKTSFQYIESYFHKNDVLNKK